MIAYQKFKKFWLFLGLSGCFLQARADMCFTDLPVSFQTSEYVLVGYADTSYMLPGLGYIVYEFVIEHSLKGFEDTKLADLPNVILVLGQKYGHISPGKRIIFVDQINTDLYQLQPCGSSFSYSQINRAKEFYGDAFPEFDTTYHGGYASLDYKYRKSHRASYFSKSNELIADLQKNGDNVSKMTRQKNHLLIVCCLVTFFLGIYQLQYAFDRKLDRGASIMSYNIRASVGFSRSGGSGNL